MPAGTHSKFQLSLDPVSNMIKVKGKRDNNPIIVGEFNILLSIVNKISR
jgi:hypothetical protein